MLMIISIFYIAFPQHGHWRSCTACFLLQFCTFIISHEISHIFAYFTKNGSSSIQW